MTFLDASDLDAFRDDAATLYGDIFTAYAPAGIAKDASGMESLSYSQMGVTPGKIQSRSREGDTTVRSITIGGQERPVVEGGLHIPVDSPAPVLGGIGKGWEYVLTNPGPFTPAELVGSRWLVVDSPAKSIMTARRLDVVRLS